MVSEEDKPICYIVQLGVLIIIQKNKYSAYIFLSFVQIGLHTENKPSSLPGGAPKVCVVGGGVEGNNSFTLWSKQ